MVTVFVSLFELIEAPQRVHRLNAMLFSMRQQKLDKLCRGYKILRPRLTKRCWGRVPGVPGGVDAYGFSASEVTTLWRYTNAFIYLFIYIVTLVLNSTPV